MKIFFKTFLEFLKMISVDMLFLRYLWYTTLVCGGVIVLMQLIWLFGVVVRLITGEPIEWGMFCQEGQVCADVFVSGTWVMAFFMSVTFVSIAVVGFISWFRRKWKKAKGIVMDNIQQLEKASRSEQVTKC